jgi:hypothetical protein
MGHDEHEVDASRRENLTALLGVLGGAVGLSALTGCANEAGAADPEVTATTQAAATGTSFEWADSIGTSGSPGDLRGITGSSALHTVVAGGFWLIGDGGGGVFHWDPNSSLVDDGGTVINPTNHMGNGRWKRVYTGPLNVKWFGARGDGATDDYQAIQSTITAALLIGNNTSQALAAGDNPNAIYATPAVEFAAGIYKLASIGGPLPTLVVKGINDMPSISSSQSFRMFCESTAVLHWANPTAGPILVFDYPAVTNEIRGIAFHGGTNQVQINGPNGSGNLINFLIERCEFHESGDYAVSTVTSGSTYIGGTLTMENCSFGLCAGLLNTQCDFSILQNCSGIIGTPTGVTPKSAQIVNGNAAGTTYSQLYMSRFTAANGLTNDATHGGTGGVHWIDNYGRGVHIHQCWFKGDGGGNGMPIVYHYTAYPTQDYDSVGSHIVIRDSLLCMGDVAPASIVYIKNDVSGYTSALPVKIVINGVAPSVDLFQLGQNPPIILAANHTNLANAINAYLAQQSNAALVPLTISVDPDLMAASGPMAVDAALVPFVDPIVATPFPVGLLPAAVSSGGNFEATFNVPNGTTPSGFNPFGFVALVTIQASANSGYISCATYMVSMTQDWDVNLGFVSVISYGATPIFTPGGASYTPSISSVMFNNGSNKISTNTPPTTFTIKCYSGFGSATPSHAYISIKLLHMLAY